MNIMNSFLIGTILGITVLGLAYLIEEEDLRTMEDEN